MTGVYTTDSSLRTSKDKAHLVMERRRMISAMYGSTMGDDIADTEPDNYECNVVVSQSITLSPSFHQAIMNSAVLAASYRHEQNVRVMRGL